MIDRKIGFIGSGQMASAIARGIVQQGFIRTEQIAICDPSRIAIESFNAAVGKVNVATSNKDLVNHVDVVVLAIKPQFLNEAIEQINGAVVEEKHLVLSIVAGATIADLSARLGTGRIVRVMPNTPCLIGSGAAAYSAGKNVDAESLSLVDQMFSALGSAVRVQESLINAVTGLSGSGPAYVFTFIQALADGGVLSGLPRQTALQLAVETVIGAAKMVRESGDHPSVLTDRVASPGGTTIAGLKALEDQGFRAAVMSAVEAATKRADALS